MRRFTVSPFKSEHFRGIYVGFVDTDPVLTRHNRVNAKIKRYRLKKQAKDIWNKMTFPLRSS